MQKHGGRLQFQSTLSQGERLCRRQTRQECKGISIHALARRATVDVDYNNDGIYISIHALARRATYEWVQRILGSAISIHALARRATKFFPIFPEQSIGFQSTLSQGERHEDMTDEEYAAAISIHALARRATATYSTRVFYT